MTKHEFKRGDWAMVKIYGVINQCVYIENDRFSSIPLFALHPLPPQPSPDLTELERAVVEAAVKRRVVYLESTSPKVHGNAVNAESAAIDALIAARKPVDPIQRVKNALGAYEETQVITDNSKKRFKKLKDAIAALETGK